MKRPQTLNKQRKTVGSKSAVLAMSVKVELSYVQLPELRRRPRSTIEVSPVLIDDVLNQSPTRWDAKANFSLDYEQATHLGSSRVCEPHHLIRL